MLAATLETVAAEGADALYTGRLGQLLLEDIAKEGQRARSHCPAGRRQWGLGAGAEGSPEGGPAVPRLQEAVPESCLLLGSGTLRSTPPRRGALRVQASTRNHQRSRRAPALELGPSEASMPPPTSPARSPPCPSPVCSHIPSHCPQTQHRHLAPGSGRLWVEGSPAPGSGRLWVEGSPAVRLCLPVCSWSCPRLAQVAS